MERVTPAKLRSSSSFLLVGNIPGRFRSSDLRAYFSQLIEKNSFLCFHYRHRPERLAASDTHDSAPSAPSAPRSCCCVVAVIKGAEGELYRLYHDKNWAYPDGELLRARVRVSNLAISLGETTGKGENKTGRSAINLL